MAETHDRAQDVEDYLNENLQATVDQIASDLEMDPVEVIEILDTHGVTEDGSVVFNGPGQGGGWAPARAAEQERVEEQGRLIDEQITERKRIMENLAKDADPGVRQGLSDMVAELERRKAELGQ